MICAANADSAMWFSKIIGSHSGEGGPSRQLPWDRLKLGPILIDLGISQYAPS